MTDDFGIDWSLFPAEAKRAIEEGGLMLEQLEPGLFARHEDDAVVLMVRDGREVGRVPLDRLRR